MESTEYYRRCVHSTYVSDEYLGRRRTKSVDGKYRIQDWRKGLEYGGNGVPHCSQHHSQCVPTPFHLQGVEGVMGKGT